MVSDRVVSGHLAGVLEADGLGERQFGGHRAVGSRGLLCGEGEPGVEAGQELLKDVIGLVDGADAGQTQLGDQTVLEG